MTKKASCEQTLKVIQDRLKKLLALTGHGKQPQGSRKVMNQRIGQLLFQGHFVHSVFLKKRSQFPVGPEGPAADVRLSQRVEQAVVVGAGIAKISDRVDQIQQRLGAGSGVLVVVKGQQSGEGSKGADFQENPDGDVGEILLHQLFRSIDPAVFHFGFQCRIGLEKLLNDGIAVFIGIAAEVPHEGDFQLMLNGQAEPENQVAKMHIQSGELYQISEVHMMIKSVSGVSWIVLQIGFDLKKVGVVSQKAGGFLL